jgi:hypothetical protein
MTMGTADREFKCTQSSRSCLPGSSLPASFQEVPHNHAIFHRYGSFQTQVPPTQGRAGAEPTVVSFPSQQPVSPEPTGLPLTKHSGGKKRCELSDAGVFQTLFQHAAN